MEEKNNNLAMNEKPKGKYIDPFTDFGFKRLFGEECNKDLLLDFLNELLYKKEGKIVSLSYIENERQGSSEEDRRAVFDISCENEKGEQFIVEMQKSKQRYFKDRILYYSTFPITSQAPKDGKWNYQLKAVYVIAILNFELEQDKNETDEYMYDLPTSDMETDELILSDAEKKLPLSELKIDKYRYNVMLTDIETNKVFYKKLKFVYLEMPNFTKTVDELETRFDKWMYVLKNLNRLDNIPDKLREKVFEKFFEVAQIAKLTRDEYYVYMDNLNNYRDWENCLDTREEKGRRERESELKIEYAIKLLKKGMPPVEVAEITGLTLEEVTEILEELKRDGLLQ